MTAILLPQPVPTMTDDNVGETDFSMYLNEDPIIDMEDKPESTFELGSAPGDDSQETIEPKKKKTPVKKQVTKKKAEKEDEGNEDDDDPTNQVVEPAEENKKKTKRKSISRSPSPVLGKRARKPIPDSPSKKKKLDEPITCICSSYFTNDQKCLLLDICHPRNLGRFSIATEINDNVTHLILGDKKRTLKVLTAISKGIWVLKAEWLDVCITAQQWVAENEYEANDWFPGCKVVRSQKKKLLKNKKVHIYRKTAVPAEELETIIVNSGGLVTDLKSCDYCFSDNLIPVNLPEKAICLLPNWLLDSLEQGQLIDISDYKLEPEEEIERPPPSSKKPRKISIEDDDMEDYEANPNEQEDEDVPEGDAEEGDEGKAKK